ncbi:hypothetical protein KY284_026722 [Solanum tuberosum]|nr:hypothetical protein KY284_026722 [Solanum tuberosum]
MSGIFEGGKVDKGNASKRRMAKMVQELWWKWAWILFSLPWDGLNQTASGRASNCGMMYQEEQA